MQIRVRRGGKTRFIRSRNCGRGDSRPQGCRFLRHELRQVRCITTSRPRIRGVARHRSGRRAARQGRIQPSINELARRQCSAWLEWPNAILRFRSGNHLSGEIAGVIGALHARANVAFSGLFETRSTPMPTVLALERPSRCGLAVQLHRPRRIVPTPISRPPLSLTRIKERQTRLIHTCAHERTNWRHESGARDSVARGGGDDDAGG